MSCDDNATATSGLLFIVPIFGAHAGLLADGFQRLAILIFTDAANVNC